MQCLRPPEEEEDGKVSKADTVKAPHVQSSRESRRDRSVPESICQGRFVLEKKLGEGSFGLVYLGMDSKRQQKVAVKLEHKKSSAVGQLGNESRLLDVFARPTRPNGFAESIYFGKEGNYAILVMDLLGLTLEGSVQACGGKVEFPTVANMAEQCIHLLAYVHSKAIVHRDIKSENFMWGIGDKVHHLYIIDFGMSTRYYMKRHVAMSTGKQLTGTARYASVNAMRGCTQSRRDDLEATGHMIMYALRGHLPWSGLDAPTYKDKLRLICEKKAKLPLPELCAGYPEEFMKFLEYSRNLDFEARPDYDALVQMFRDLRGKTEPPTPETHLQWLLPPVAKTEIDWDSLVPLSINLGEPCPLQPEEGGGVVTASASQRSSGMTDTSSAGGRSPQG